MPLLIAATARRPALAGARGLLAAVASRIGREHFPDQLSGRRAAARRDRPRAGRRAHLLLADEPTGNLDGDNAAVVFDLIARLHLSRGLTSVIVTQPRPWRARCTASCGWSGPSPIRHAREPDGARAGGKLFFARYSGAVRAPPRSGERALLLGLLREGDELVEQLLARLLGRPSRCCATSWRPRPAPPRRRHRRAELALARRAAAPSCWRATRPRVMGRYVGRQRARPARLLRLESWLALARPLRPRPLAVAARESSARCCASASRRKGKRELSLLAEYAADLTGGGGGRGRLAR